jgi:hypothetical protein
MVEAVKVPTLRFFEKKKANKKPQKKNRGIFLFENFEMLGGRAHRVPELRAHGWSL